MPIVFKDQGARFHFYSNEGDPREPAHVHVVRAGADAKIWLRPRIEIAYNRGFSAPALSSLLRVVEARAAEIERAGDDPFG